MDNYGQKIFSKKEGFLSRSSFLRSQMEGAKESVHNESTSCIHSKHAQRAAARR
jgi:hypothetical protein